MKGLKNIMDSLVYASAWSFIIFGSMYLVAAWDRVWEILNDLRERFKRKGV